MTPAPGRVVPPETLRRRMHVGGGAAGAARNPRAAAQRRSAGARTGDVRGPRRGRARPDRRQGDRALRPRFRAPARRPDHGARDRREPPLARRLHSLLRGGARGPSRARPRARQGRGAARARQARTRWAPLQDQGAGRAPRRADHRRERRRADRRQGRNARRQADAELRARRAGDPRRGGHRRHLRARDQPPPGASAPGVLELYKDQQIVERRHRDLKQTLKDRPIFLHNDDRIYALISTVGIALPIFGLIESETRRALGDDEQLPGLLPEGRAAKPTGRNILTAFQGLGLTYTRDGITLDRLTHTQQRILELIEIQPPWPQQGNLAA